MSGVTTVEIPNRSLFRQPEVCEIAQVQPYVLRSWEAEFPDLGVAKTEGGPRVYRRADLECVLRIKHLLFVEGLTLAGARRKLVGERPPTRRPLPTRRTRRSSTLLGSDARERILQVKRGAARDCDDARRRIRGRDRLARTTCSTRRGAEGARSEARKPRRRRRNSSRSVSSASTFRDVAQPGSAPDWGSGGRWFESSHPDQFSSLSLTYS